jgi:hypothetical protein
MKVQNHKRYGSEGYEQQPNNQVELGDILYRYVDGYHEIGVVIQTFQNGDFRTHMWGVDSHANLATYDQIKKYSPELFDDKAPEYVCGECGWEGDEITVKMEPNRYNRRDKTLYENHYCPGCGWEI